MSFTILHCQKTIDLAKNDYKNLKISFDLYETYLGKKINTGKGYYYYNTFKDSTIIYSYIKIGNNEIYSIFKNDSSIFISNSKPKLDTFYNKWENIQMDLRTIPLIYGQRKYYNKTPITKDDFKLITKNKEIFNYFFLEITNVFKDNKLVRNEIYYNTNSVSKNIIHKYNIKVKILDRLNWNIELMNFEHQMSNFNKNLISNFEKIPNIMDLKLINVRNNLKFDFSEIKDSFYIIDFSYLACGPCIYNHYKLDSIIKINEKIKIIVIDPYFSEKDKEFLINKINKNVIYLTVNKSDLKKFINFSFPTIKIFYPNGNSEIIIGKLNNELIKKLCKK